MSKSLKEVLECVIETLMELNDTEDRNELIAPLLLDINKVLDKLEDPIEKIYWENLEESKRLSDEGALVILKVLGRGTYER